MSAVGGTLGLPKALAAAGHFGAAQIESSGLTRRVSPTSLSIGNFLSFTAALAIATGIISGTVPALHASRPELTEALKAGSRGTTYSASQSLRHALVIGELGLAVLLVCGAGLLIKSLWALSHVNPGFRSDNVLTARVTPNESLCDEPARCTSSFIATCFNQVRSLPGVTNAALINTLPLGGRVQKRSVNIENFVTSSSDPEPLLWMDAVSPGYFQAMGIPLVRGREFTLSQILSGKNSHAADHR